MRTPRRWALPPHDQRSHLLAERGTGNSPDSGRPPVPADVVPPLISADVAARALQECFLANADRGDNAANDELVAELVRRIRTLRSAREDGC
ncbi:MAG: hypothetical protein ACRDRR_11410 [Pseudonocardiaceae bacterium]